MNKSIERRATLACLYAGAVWGLFWIPLRALEKAGLQGLWVTAVYFLVPTLCLLPVLIKRRKQIMLGGLSFQITALMSGAALTFYATSILYTDVIRAMMLFYMMPIWSVILARVFLGERIIPVRIAAMAMAFVGMLILFGLGLEFPLPRNVGDWLGLAAGGIWAVTMLRLRIYATHSAMDLTVGFFLWGLILSGGAALVLTPASVPTWTQTLPAVPMLLLFVVMLVIPGTIASLWGPKFLNPGVVGLLFMTELVVGAVSAAIWAGEPFGLREFVGVVLISGASLLEPIKRLVFASRTA
ncbi:DMT family transporter [Ascidiaceihabitans sp.]|uniref:DMT family transporter n=1 Tax=Ascidiaceihabitans sp. TaxID=1872644 RepID=UPI00329736AB